MNATILNGTTGRITKLKNVGMDVVTREMSRMLREGIADPTVKRLAFEATAHTDEPVSAIFNFVRDNFQYQLDPADTELFIHPRRMAVDYYMGRRRSGDCDDHALWTAAMLGSLGYKVRILIVDRSGDWDHALAQVLTGTGEWLNLDTVAKNPLGWIQEWNRTLEVYP